MKHVLQFLEKYHVLKNGYLNPLLLWGFLILTPTTFFLNGQLHKDDSDILSDDEIASLIMNELQNDTTFYCEEKLNTGVCSVEHDSKTSSVYYVPKSISIANKIALPIHQNNLDVLMEKAKYEKSNISHWDVFRLKVYMLAKEIKQTYPDIQATPNQLYDWIMKTFSQESKFKHDARNPHSTAQGLFQAMKAQRGEIGMPDVSVVPILQQVDYYKKYLDLTISQQHINTSNIKSALDWYLIVFYPALADKPSTAVFAKCAGYDKKYCRNKKGWKHCNYHANVCYDVHHRGIITKSDIGENLTAHYK